MSHNQKVSVCMATYNGEMHIKEQVCSVLSQLNKEDELVICDDLSTDSTEKIVSELAEDKRVKYIRNNNKLGVAKTFENALLNSTGDYIFLCDQDDVWEPNKISVCLKALEKNILVISDCTIVDSQLNTIHESFYERRKSRKGIFSNLYRNSYIGCCMAFKRELLDYALPMPLNIPMHDMWLGLIAECIGQVTFVSDKLVLYRRHDKNVSLLDSKSSIMQKIRYRIILFNALVTRLIKLQKNKS